MQAQLRALAFSALLPFGPHLGKELSPLEPYFLAEHGWGASMKPPEAWGMLQSAYVIAVAGTPIFGGWILDRTGSLRSLAIIATTLVLVGQVLLIVAEEHKSFLLALVSRVISGAGQGNASLLACTAIAYQFQNSTMTFAEGFMQSFHSLSSVLSFALPAMVAASYGPGPALLPAVVACAMSLAVAITMPVDVPTDDGQCSDRYVRLEEPAKEHQTSRSMLTMSLLLIVGGLLSTAHRLFNHVSTSYLDSAFGYQKEQAALSASLAESSGIILCPLVGILVDRFGGHARGTAVGLLVSCLIGIAASCYIMLGQPSLVTSPVPLLLTLSGCNALLPTLLKSLVPSCVPQSLFGRCYAGFEVLEAVGTFVGAFVLGFLVPDGTQGAIGGTWFFSGMLLVAFTLSGALYLALRKRACVRYAPALV
mmetsp:Transcript_4642/g.10238  ORF Transcript_4642/g.10238 Transcript_4642/m.10238 type:complete len:422 (+) Transcript_4642:19-1284(+)